MRALRIIVLLMLIGAASALLPVPPWLISSSATLEREPATKVLFIGNSFTSFGDIPSLVSLLSESSSSGPVFTSSVVRGGATLEYHWQSGHAQAQIEKGNWDFVVLQEQSMRPILNPERMETYALYIHGSIQQAGAKTALYMTWADLGRTADQRRITAQYRNLAHKLDALLVPVGLAWEQAMRRNPSMRLHAPDNHHQNPLGAYLAACVFVAAITGELSQNFRDSVTLPPKRFWHYLDPRQKKLGSREDLAFLRSIAREVMLSEQRNSKPLLPSRQGWCFGKGCSPK